MNTMNFLMMETMNNLEQYLGETGCAMYQKLAGSSEGAMWQRGDYLANLRLTDMTTDGPIDYALLELSPGISVPKPYRAQVAQYIQTYMISDIGGLVVDDGHDGELIYSIQTPMIENAITVETFRVLEDFAARQLRMHRPALEALAGGSLPDSLPSQAVAPELEDKLNDEQLRSFSDGIHNYLVNESHHNAISEYTDEGGLPHWLCELYVSSDHYFMEISLSRSGIATMKLRRGARGVLTAPAYRRAMAKYLNDCSAPRKVGFFRVGSGCEGVTNLTNISMLDGPVGKKTMDELEGILITATHRTSEQAARLAHGMVPEKEEDEEDPAEKLRGMLPKLPGLLEHLRGRIAASPDDDDDDDDGDGDTLSPNDFLRSDLLRRLQQLRDARTGTDDAEDDNNGLPPSDVTSGELPF